MVKRVFMLSLAVFFICASYCSAQTISNKMDVREAQQMFTKGVEFYKRGEFKKSSMFFKMILDANIQSGAVYFNLGNSYFKMGELAKARVAYEKADVLIPRDKELDGNLAYLKSKLEDNIELPKQNVLWRVYYFAGNRFNRNELAFIVLGIYILLMLLWLCAMIFSAMRRIVFPIIILVFCIFIWFGSVFFAKLSVESHPRYAIVIPDEVPVRWGNTEGDKVAFYLHSGTKVIIRQIRDNWMLITIGKDKSGWIKNSCAEVI